MECSAQAKKVKNPLTKLNGNIYLSISSVLLENFRLKSNNKSKISTNLTS